MCLDVCERLGDTTVQRERRFSVPRRASRLHAYVDRDWAHLTRDNHEQELQLLLFYTHTHVRRWGQGVRQHLQRHDDIDGTLIHPRESLMFSLSWPPAWKLRHRLVEKNNGPGEGERESWALPLHVNRQRMRDWSREPHTDTFKILNEARSKSFAATTLPARICIPHTRLGLLLFFRCARVFFRFEGFIVPRVYFSVSLCTGARAPNG